MMHDVAFLHEVREVMAPIIRRLSGAGFDDIHDDEILVLTALGINHKAAGDLARMLGVADQKVGPITKTLILRGYLELRDDPYESGRTWTATTKRGSAAYNVVGEEIKAQRWADFPFRQGDIVISALPKSGTTWMQMICALLIFQTPDLPAPLQELSPWLEHTKNTRRRLFPKLAAQEHRRLIKTHMPLNEIRIDSRATYIVVARHPLDAMLSSYHHHVNVLQRGRTEKRRGQPQPDRVPSPREWMLRSIDEDAFRDYPLPDAMRHLSNAWACRSEPNVVLLHYEDLTADLEGQMRRLSARLGISVPETAWSGLVKAATFEQMRAAAGRIQPLHVLENPADFFRSGKSGSGSALLTSAELAHYYNRAAQLAPAELLAWLHRQDGSARKALHPVTFN